MRLLLLLVIAALFLPARVSADAIVWTQAMFASTIAEYFIEDDRITVELEIGLGDLNAFQNLLPDDIYERLGNPPLPFRDRLRTFFEQDFAIFGDEGKSLPSRILEIAPRDRVKRDPITGEPMPDSGEDGQLVIVARLEYEMLERPQTLSFGAPAGASVGFVAYHHGIAVNDFRYLAPRVTLELDWEDPWYTRFRSRTLRRQSFAPMSGFLYVEPYEVRKEIIARPKDLQNWVDLGLEGRETIPVEMQPELKRTVAEFLRNHHPVTIDGESIPGELARINFLERTLRTSRVIDPPVELDVHSAILGVIFVYSIDGLPEQVTMDWDLWDGRLQRIPAASVDQSGPLQTLLEPDFRVLEWRNFLKNPVLPTLKVLAPPPSPLALWVWNLRWLLVSGAVGVLVWSGRRRYRGGDGRAPALAVAVALLVTTAGLWWGSGARFSDARAGEVVSGLLHNIYRAFDFRDEGKIYDVLAKSVEGELLTEIYLETRRGLELANQGGARAKVKEIEMIDLASEPGPEGAFTAQATWNVSGSVGHWGHVHQRRNQYQAELYVTPIDGVWKLAHLEILQEERL